MQLLQRFIFLLLPSEQIFKTLGHLSYNFNFVINHRFEERLDLPQQELQDTEVQEKYSPGAEAHGAMLLPLGSQDFL